MEYTLPDSPDTIRAHVLHGHAGGCTAHEYPRELTRIFRREIDNPEAVPREICFYSDFQAAQTVAQYCYPKTRTP